MKPIHYLILAMFCTAFFAAYVLVYPWLNNADSYYFLNHVCNGTKIDTEPIAAIIFQLIPCNTIIIKLILTILLFISLIAVSKLGEMFSTNHGWLAGLFVFLSPIWIIYFSDFENDAFAFPLIFWGLYFFLKGEWGKKTNPKLLGLALIGIAGLIWKGSIFYLAILSFYNPVIAGIVIIFLALNLNIVFDTILPNANIIENMAFIGSIFLFTLFAGLLAYRNWPFYKEFRQMTWKPMLVLLLIGVINSKFIMLVVPFLAVGLVKVFETMGRYGKIFMLVLLFFSAFVFIMNLRTFIPTSNEWQAIDYAQQLSLETGKPLTNDWSFGHWMHFKGIDTNSFENYGEQPDSIKDSVYVGFTIGFPQQTDSCELLQTFGVSSVWNC